MFQPFQGTLTGHGLDHAVVTGEIEPVQQPITMLRHRGRFRWRGAHRFRANEVYRLNLATGEGYDIMIANVSQSVPSLVEFTAW
jgi:hypothetical protein